MKSLVSQRKGQIGALPMNIMLLGTAALVLVMMVIIGSGIRDTNVVRQALSGSKINETTTAAVTEVGVALAQNTAPGVSCVILQATNATSAILINSANYTVTGGCTIKYSYTAASIVGINNSFWNVTYSFTQGDQAYVNSNQTIVGLGTFGTFWSIIVLALVAAIVLGIIFGVFGRPGSNNR